MATLSRIEPQKAAAPDGATEQHDSGIRALAAVARHQGLDWSLTRLNHVYGKDHEPDARALVRMARAEGMKAELQRMDWKRLNKPALSSRAIKNIESSLYGSFSLLLIN